MPSPDSGAPPRSAESMASRSLFNPLLWAKGAWRCLGIRKEVLALLVASFVWLVNHRSRQNYYWKTSVERSTLTARACFKHSRFRNENAHDSSSSHVHLRRRGA